MNFLMPRWLLGLSIRWKLQISFFLVTMITIVVNRMVGYGELKHVIDIAKEHGVEEALISDLDARLSAYITDSFWQSGIEFLILFAIIAVLAKRFVAPIKSLCTALEGIEKGDLTQAVENKSHDEIGILERSFNGMLSNLTNIIRNIDDNSKQMAQSAYQVAAISHEIADVSKAEHSRSEEVASATEQLRSISDSVHTLAEDVSLKAKQTESRAQEGIDAVQTNIAQMQTTVDEVGNASQEIESLKASADQIHEILGTISEIAEQTNLLALNAAIEAARAGETGRGFAVVADEVRSLAARTAASTDEINKIINELSTNVGSVSGAMQSVVSSVHISQEKTKDISSVIERMTSEVSETAEVNHQISDVSSEQLDKFKFLSASLDRLFETFGESSAKVETTATIGDDLYRVSESMNKVLAGFVYEREDVILARENEKRMAPRVNAHLRIHVDHNGQAYETICRDLSMTGMQLRFNQKLDKKHPLSLKIYLPFEDLDEYANQLPVDIQAKIAWQRQSDEEYLCGVKFVDVTNQQTDQLNECFTFFNKKPEFGSG